MKYSPVIALAYFKSQGIEHAPSLEFRFHPTRKWRMDFAWPEHRLALEVEGGLFLKGKRAGGHSRGSGRVKDHEKFSEAAALGWRFIFCQPRELMTLKTVDLIRRSLAFK